MKNLFSPLKLLFSIFIIFPTIYLLGETFVVAKKKKMPSVSKLKEQCCEECAAILEITPELLRTVADVHQTALSNVRCYVDGGKEGFIACTSKDELAESLQKLKKLHSRMECLIQEIHECQSSLQTLDSKAKNEIKLPNSK